MAEINQAVPATESAEAAGAGPHEHCVTDRPTPDGPQPKGELIKLNDVEVYVSKPSDYPQTPGRLLLFLTGGTGVHSTNNQLQADMYASEGFLVVMPDIFNNDPAPNTETIAESEAKNALDLMRLRAVEVGKSFMIDMWLARNTEAKSMPIIYKVLDACKDEYADAVTSGGGVYAVGYCIGARYVLLLGAEEQSPQWGWHQPSADEESGPSGGPLIKVGALAHAASVLPDDFKTLRVPVSVVCVENDPLFPDETRVEAEDAMRLSGIEHEVQVYPQVPHGFAVVGDYKDQNIKDAQATAYEQMLKWLKEH